MFEAAQFAEMLPLFRIGGADRGRRNAPRFER
jgi:hypothetical protein